MPSPHLNDLFRRWRTLNLSMCRFIWRWIRQCGSWRSALESRLLLRGIRRENLLLRFCLGKIGRISCLGLKTLLTSSLLMFLSLIAQLFRSDLSQLRPFWSQGRCCPILWKCWIIHTTFCIILGFYQLLLSRISKFFLLRRFLV